MISLLIVIREWFFKNKSANNQIVPPTADGSTSAATTDDVLDNLSGTNPKLPPSNSSNSLMDHGISN